MGTNKGVGRFQTLNHILRVYIFDKIQKQFWFLIGLAIFSTLKFVILLKIDSETLLKLDNLSDISKE